MKKPKKKTRSKLVKELDNIFSRFIRLRSSNKFGVVQCYTCGDYDHRKKLQCWHFITRGNYKYRRDEDNCKPQCMKCNIFLSWNYKVFTINMIYEYGRDKIEMMIHDKELVKISTPTIQEKINMYTLKVIELENNIVEKPKQ